MLGATAIAVPTGSPTQTASAASSRLYLLIIIRSYDSSGPLLDRNKLFGCGSFTRVRIAHHAAALELVAGLAVEQPALQVVHTDTDAILLDLLTDNRR